MHSWCNGQQLGPGVPRGLQAKSRPGHCWQTPTLLTPLGFKDSSSPLISPARNFSGVFLWRRTSQKILFGVIKLTWVTGDTFLQILFYLEHILSVVIQVMNWPLRHLGKSMWSCIKNIGNVCQILPSLLSAGVGLVRVVATGTLLYTNRCLLKSSGSNMAAPVSQKRATEFTPFCLSWK